MILCNSLADHFGPEAEPGDRSEPVLLGPPASAASWVPPAGMWPACGPAGVRLRAAAGRESINTPHPSAREQLSPVRRSVHIACL